MRRKAFVAIPSHSGKPSMQTEYTSLLFEMEANGLGWEYQRWGWHRDSLVTHARAVCVGMFMASDATDLIFLDDDVGAGPGVFTRLMTPKVDFVAAIYRTKTDDEKYMVHWLDSKEPDPVTGLIEARHVPIGCARFSRSMIERMVEAHKDEWFRPHALKEVLCWDMFNCGVFNHEYVGEDFWFCHTWRKLGGKVWLDAELPTVHVDETGKVYKGHLGNFLRTQNELDDSAGDTGPAETAAPNPENDRYQFAAD